jgi:NDP-sugar pyrophosphorylase family protein
MSEPLLPVVILAGGLATRLGEAARSQPKCLVEVGGEPFLFHQLRQLRGQGVRQVTMCVGHLGEQVVAAVGDGSAFGLEVSFSFDGPTLVGTAGAIKRALPGLPGAFFVLYGDSYLRCDFAAAQAAFRASDALALMTVFRNETRWDTSNVEFRDGRILAYDKDKAHQTDRMRHIDYGLGILDRRALDVVPEGRPYDLAAVYQEMLRIGRLAAMEVSERFYEIGSPAGLEETRGFLAGVAGPGGSS